jgi:hypothetical protein
MNSRELIRASRTHLRKCPPPVSHQANLTTLFPSGAKWMHDRLQELEAADRQPADLQFADRQPANRQPADPHPFNPNINYSSFGLLKYGSCIAGFATSASVLPTYGLLFTPLPIAVFYLIEIHTLFLFPLLIDQTPRPLLTSVKATYKIGIGRCFFTVIPIAAYMLLGLLRLSNPLRNWYIGCLAIIIWYKNEIRAGI